MKQLLIQEWFGDRVSNKEYNILEPTSDRVSNKEYNILEPNPTPPLTDSDYQMLGLSNKDIRHLRTNLTPDQKRQLLEFRQKIQHRLDLLNQPNSAIKRISYYFPTSRKQALPVGLLANQWGLTLPYFRSLLDRIPALQIDLGGIGGTDRYWIQKDPNQSAISLSRSIIR